MLRCTLSSLQVDFEQKNDLAGHYQARLKESQEELRVKQRMMVRGTPTLVLLKVIRANVGLPLGRNSVCFCVD